METEKLLHGMDLMLMLIDIIERDGLRSFCRKHSLDPGNVSNVLNLKKPMQPAIANALGFVEVKRYMPTDRFHRQFFNKGE